MWSLQNPHTVLIRATSPSTSLKMFYKFLLNIWPTNSTLHTYPEFIPPQGVCQKPHSASISPTLAQGRARSLSLSNRDAPTAAGTYAMMAVWRVAFPGMEYAIPCTPDIESPSPRWKVEDSVVCFFFYFEGIFLHILTVEYLKIVSNILDHWDWLRFVFGRQARGFFVKVPCMLTPVTHRWVVFFTW